MEFKREFLNVPNSLSFSRILLLPVLALLTYVKWDFIFLLTYIIVGSTDYFDGKIARRWNITSEFGKTIDSVADLFFYLGTLGFVYFWFPQIVIGNRYLIMIFFVFLIASFAISWIKIGKPILMHTNLLRLNAVLVYLLVIVSFFVTFLGVGEKAIPVYFGTVILVIYFLAFAEEILIFIFYGDVDRDTRFIWELWDRNGDR